MNFYRLQVFKCYVECESLSVVAKRMNVTVPAIVQNLKLLQEELGFTLYKKINSRPMFTPKALSLYESIKDKFNGIETAWSETISGKVKKTVTIMGPYAHLNRVLIPTFGKIMSRENVFIKVDYGNSSLANSGLLSGKIDVGVVSSPLAETVAKSVLIHQEELILVCRKKYAKKILREDSCIKIDVVDMSGDLRLFSMWSDKNGKMVKHKIDAKLIASVGSIEGIISMVCSHDVVSVIPKHLISSYLKSGALVNIFPKCNKYLNRVYASKLKRRKDEDIDLFFSHIIS